MSIRRLRWRFYRKPGIRRSGQRRCPDYFAGCIVCEAYRYFDQYGRFPAEEQTA